MYTVYVIVSDSTERIYIGQTDNLEKRIKQHNDVNFDKRSYTKLLGKNWNVVYKEEYQTRIEAIQKEKFFKSHIGRDWLRKNILGL